MKVTIAKLSNRIVPLRPPILSPLRLFVASLPLKKKLPLLLLFLMFLMFLMLLTLLPRFILLDGSVY